MSVSQTVKAVVRQAQSDGTTRYAIAKRAGIGYDTLARFLDRDRDIRVSNVERLATSLGLELRPTKATDTPE